MRIKAIKTRVIHPPKDNLPEALSKPIKKLPENSIVIITSKVVSIWEGRCIHKSKVKSKKDLVKKEADLYSKKEVVKGLRYMPVIKNNLFVGSAGIDESNANDYYILWPEDAWKSARKLYDWIRKKYSVKKVGVIITDSHIAPFRRGTSAVALAFYGFKPFLEYTGTKDLFGRKFKVSKLNIPDSLANAAHVLMGEGTERTPAALVTDLPEYIKFTNKPYKPGKRFESFEIPLEEDLYFSLIKGIPWEKGGGGKE